MEIERKFLVKKENIPKNLKTYPHDELEQAYLITNPVLRIRKKNHSYILTYKGAGLMKREEAEFPLTKDSYTKLLSKTEGNIITKTRYRIPERENLTIELDIFSGIFTGLFLAEIEFPDEETALAYTPPIWFAKEVTNDSTFQNSTLSSMNEKETAGLLSSL